MTVTEIIPLDKRRSKVILDEDFALALYNGEIKRYHMEAGDVSGDPGRDSVKARGGAGLLPVEIFR